MVELWRKIDDLINEEYVSAAAKHGRTHHSAHEAYAIILEEMEEAEAEQGEVWKNFGLFWREVKNGSNPDHMLDYLAWMRKFVVRQIAELIQVAAMVEKGLVTFEENEE